MNISSLGVGYWTVSWNPHPGCLLAATTAFVQAASPQPAAWDACTHARAPSPAEELPHGG